MKIMYEYMADIDLPVPFEAEFILLIPAQREFINKLMSEKIITSYAVSIEDGKLWTTVLAENEQLAEEVITEFPIIGHIRYRISKLAFHNSIGFTVPQFSLN